MCCMLDKQGDLQAHTCTRPHTCGEICNTYRFSSATMICEHASILVYTYIVCFGIFCQGMKELFTFSYYFMQVRSLHKTVYLSLVTEVQGCHWSERRLWSCNTWWNAVWCVGTNIWEQPTVFIFRELRVLPWRCRQRVFPKNWYMSTTVCGIISVTVLKYFIGLVRRHLVGICGYGDVTLGVIDSLVTVSCSEWQRVMTVWLKD
jgi:hypothetical protein